MQWNFDVLKFKVPEMKFELSTGYSYGSYRFWKAYAILSILFQNISSWNFSYPDYILEKKQLEFLVVLGN